MSQSLFPPKGDWMPEGYRLPAHATEKDHERARAALNLLLDGKLTAYSIGYQTRLEGASTLVDCVSGEQARSEAVRRHGGRAREIGTPLYVQRSGSPSGRYGWVRPAGWRVSIELADGLHPVPPESEWSEPGKQIEFAPDELDLFA